MSAPEPYFSDDMVTVHLGDCLDVLAGMEAESIDAVVCDPPYDLTAGKKGGTGEKSLNVSSPAGRSRVTTGGFMGKDWDSTGVAFRPETWQAVLRVLKPGGYLLAFGGTRTWHRLVCAIEDAGFEIRDGVADLTGIDGPGLLWLCGSGFPKSLDVSKAIDKARRRDYVLAAVRLGMDVPGRNLDDWTKEDHSPGDKWWAEFKEHLSAEQWGAVEREVVGHWKSPGRGSRSPEQKFGLLNDSGEITAPATEDAARWQGFGTSLKPAWEPIAVGRKPLAGTVAANVLQFGTGALNIDGCRVPTSDADAKAMERANTPGSGRMKAGGSPIGTFERSSPTGAMDTTAGRWPPNVLLGEEAAAELDRQSGKAGAFAPVRGSEPSAVAKDAYGQRGRVPGAFHDDEGGASRFFPVFQNNQKCALSAMLSVCENANCVADQYPLTALEDSAASDASDYSSPGSTGRSERSPSSALTAESSSSSSPGTVRDSVGSPAPTSPSAWSVQLVSSAGTLCASCATAIARSAAATSLGHSGTRELGLPSTADFSEIILTRSLALCAEALEKHGITSTTQDLTTSLGFVVDAIRMYTTREFRPGSKKSVLKYEPKAGSAERPRLADGTAHVTVKPVSLMRWLVRLVTPPGGVVLDPFAGSGTTGEACIVEGFRSVLVERDPKYAELIMTRLRKPMQPDLFGGGAA